MIMMPTHNSQLHSYQHLCILHKISVPEVLRYSVFVYVCVFVCLPVYLCVCLVFVCLYLCLSKSLYVCECVVCVKVLKEELKFVIFSLKIKS